MKKRWFRGLLIGLGILVLLYVLLVLAVPLWVRLGLKPVCITSGDGTLKLVKCPETIRVQVPSIPLALPTQAQEGPMPVLFDDDGSPDGVLALLYFLEHPDYDVRAVTISVGEAHPELFAQEMIRMLASLDREDLPVGYGQELPLEGSNAFPSAFRQASDAFWGVSLQPSGTSITPLPAVDLIIQILHASEQPMLVFVSGTHTNLAGALRKDPSIAEHIAAVYIMGGAVRVPGNIARVAAEIDNSVAEWNIWVDPLAASEVFRSGLPLHLVPLDSSEQVSWSKADLEQWDASKNGLTRLAYELASARLAAWGSDQMLIWDLVTAASATDPRLCPESPLSLEVLTAAGPTQGQTVETGGAPNIQVCLAANATQIKSRVITIFNE